VTWRKAGRSERRRCGKRQRRLCDVALRVGDDALAKLFDLLARRCQFQ
jgi:hypothetical protein